MSNDGGPAFPVECYWDNGKPTYGVQTGNAQGFAMGMSLRDYFAAAALTGLIADRQYGYGGDLKEPRNHHYVAMHAYAFADALLATRTETHHD